MIPVEPPAEVRVVRGPVGSGKTERLVGLAAQLTAEGADPGRVLVLCAAPWGCETLRRRLSAAGVSERVRVSCPAEMAQAVLALPDASRFIGRSVRVAAGEDADNLLGVCRGRPGRKERRQREMVRFFCRRWSELAGDDGEEWLLPGEEESLHEVALRRLADLDAVLRCEVSALAVRYLRERPATLESLQADYVLADDYLALCRASQVLCSMLALRGLYVAADAEALAEGCEDYPFAGGLDELLAASPAANVEELSLSRLALAPARVFNAVRAELGLPILRAAEGLGQGRVEELEFPTPEAEMRGVVARVRRAVEEGADPRDVCVACLHPVWRDALQKALGSVGVQVADARRLAGLAPQVLIVCGFAEGVVFPLRYYDVTQMVGDAKERLRARRLHLLHDVFGRAREQLVVTRFMQAKPEEAQELGLRVGRVRVIDGERTCLMEPCEALGLVRCGVDGDNAGEGVV